MHPTFKIFEKILLFLRLAGPIVLTQFSLIAGSFVAILLSGQYSTLHLAGVSVGYNIWTACFFGAMGILLGISPIIAQLLGADKKENIPTIIAHGLYLAVGLGSLLILAGILALEPVLKLINLAPDAQVITIDYMIAIAFGIIPLMGSTVLRNSVDAHGFTHYSMMIMVSSFVLNVLLNYAFILGHFGLPAFGGVGAGIATAISCWYNLLAYILILLFNKNFKHYKVFRQWPAFQSPYIVEQLTLGVPIGIAIFCEMSIFSLAGLLMAYYGTEIIAAHQAAISFTNLFYGFPLSISIASTITVGYEVGAQRFRDAKQYAYIARGIAIIIAILICMYSFTHLEQIAGFYTNDPHMTGLISSFLAYAVFFTVIDAFGTPLQGILRGYKDVRIISIIALSCYWGVSTPIAALFTFGFDFGSYGIWMGLLGGLTAASIAYTVRVWYIQHRRYAKELEA